MHACHDSFCGDAKNDRCEFGDDVWGGFVVVCTENGNEAVGGVEEKLDDDDDGDLPRGRRTV